MFITNGNVKVNFFKKDTEFSQKISTHLLTVLIIHAIVQLEQRKREIERDKEIKKSFPSGLTQVPKKETGKQQLRF